MKAKLGYPAASGLIAGVVGVVATTGCAERLLEAAQVSTVVERAVPVAAKEPVKTGSLNVTLDWPALDRNLQYVYAGSFVAAVEVFLYDSQGNYQSALVVRNPAANGNAAGRATVPFNNVPAGPCIVTVHTTARQLMGDLIKPTTTSSGSFTLTTTGDGTGLVNTAVIPVLGDQTSPFIVFNSKDLITSPNTAGGPNVFLTSARIFKNTRAGYNEMTDNVSGQPAGYGQGVGTATVPAAGTTEINVQVSQAPTFGTTLYGTYDQTLNAGDTVTLAANNVSASDMLLLSETPLLTTQDVFDLATLADPAKGATYSIARFTSTTLTFNPSRAIPPSGTDATATMSPKVNVYLLRGTMVSLLNLTSAAPPKVKILPLGIDSASTTFATTNARKSANQTDTLILNLKDKFGNPISDLGANAGMNRSVGISFQIYPAASKLANIFIPGQTYGAAGAMTCATPVTAPGKWTGTFTQGALTATDAGSSSFVPFLSSPRGAGTTVFNGPGQGLPDLFVPSSLAGQLGTRTITAGVTAPGGIVTLELFAGTSTTSVANKFAEKSPPGFGSAVIKMNPLSSFKVGVATISYIATGAIVVAEDTTKWQYSNNAIGFRSIGDTDTVEVFLASDSATTSKTVTYTWQ